MDKPFWNQHPLLLDIANRQIRLRINGYERENFSRDM